MRYAQTLGNSSPKSCCSTSLLPNIFVAQHFCCPMSCVRTSFLANALLLKVLLPNLFVAEILNLTLGFVAPLAMSYKLLTPTYRLVTLLTIYIAYTACTVWVFIGTKPRSNIVLAWCIRGMLIAIYFSKLFPQPARLKYFCDWKVDSCLTLPDFLDFSFPLELL